MGRLSQLIWFLNSDKLPSKEQEETTYTHLTISPNLKKLRTKYRNNIKKEEQEEVTNAL